MITNNYYEALKQFFYPAYKPSIKDINGTSNKITFSQSSIERIFFTLLSVVQSTAGGVMMGTDDTPATVNDYRLNGELVHSRFASTVTASDELLENGNVKKTVVFTLTNNTSEDITIKEVGYVFNNSSKYYLVDRTVLSNPLTVASGGGVGQLTYSIEITFPTLE